MKVGGAISLKAGAIDWSLICVKYYDTLFNIIQKCTVLYIREATVMPYHQYGEDILGHA